MTIRNPLDWKIDDLMEMNHEAVDEHNKKQYEINHKIYMIFTTKEGKEVLEWLKQNTTEAATWMSSLPYDKAVAHGFAREGQNALVRELENRIENHKTKVNRND